MMTYPLTPFSCGVTPAAQALAFAEALVRFPRKGAISVQPPRGFHVSGFTPPWGGLAEA